MTLDDLKARTDGVTDDECWIWTSTTSSTGHAIIKPRGCPCTLARRLAFSARRCLLFRPIVSTILRGCNRVAGPARMAAYRDAMPKVTLSGPTYLAPIIAKAANPVIKVTA